MIEVFGAEMFAWMIGIVVLYYFLALAPLWIPGILVYRRKVTKPWLFVILVSSITYGLITFFLALIALPAEILSIFVSPSLDEAGKTFGQPIASISYFFSKYFLFIVPFIQILISIFITIKLSSNWENVCEAIKR